MQQSGLLRKNNSWSINIFIQIKMATQFTKILNYYYIPFLKTHKVEIHKIRKGQTW
jgi:hypothetical protein